MQNNNRQYMKNICIYWRKKIWSKKEEHMI